MTAAEPREIRLSEIPTELRNLRDEIDRWRLAHAKAVTREGELERQLKDQENLLEVVVKSRAAARQTCDDLTRHCEGQGKRIASLETDRKHLRGFVQTIWDLVEVETRVPTTIEEIRGALREYLSDHGADCEECRGSGLVADEEMVPWGGSSNGYSTRTIAVECGDCANGKVPAR